MKIVYIAGKYRSREGVNGIYENIQFARKYAVKYWKLGYAVICPHTNTGLMDGVGTDDLFLNGDLEMIKRVDVIVMIPGWKQSIGAVVEHDLAESLGLEIIYEDAI